MLGTKLRNLANLKDTLAKKPIYKEGLLKVVFKKNSIY